MNQQALLFDLDGTLLDSAPAFLHALDDYCERIGKPALTEHRYHFASAGARAAMSAIHDIPLDHPQLEQHRHEFLEIFLDAPLTLNSWYSGIADWLTQLKADGIPWGIVTNKPRPHSEAVLKHLLDGQLPACLVCQGDLATMKPEPEMLLHAAAQLSLPARSCLYAGDHLRDVQAAQAANMVSIACTYGYLHLDDDPLKWQADTLANSPEELIQKATLWLSKQPL